MLQEEFGAWFLLWKTVPYNEARVFWFWSFLFGLFWFGPDIKNCSDIKKMNKAMAAIAHLDVYLPLITHTNASPGKFRSWISGSEANQGRDSLTNRWREFAGYTCEIRETSLENQRNTNDCFMFTTNANCYNLNIASSI